MGDAGSHSVHRWASHDGRPKGNADRLMPKTNTKNWNLRRNLLYDLDAAPRFMGSTGAGRKNDRAGGKCRTSGDINLVAANHCGLATELAKVSRQIVNERVVVI